MNSYLKSYFEGGKILIVEDDLISSLLLKEYLCDVEVDIIEVCCSSDALLAFQSDDTISLVLLDILLPDENGLMLATKMKKLRPNVPIIAQTALALEEHQQILKKSCCDGYLLKPITKSDLLEGIYRIILSRSSYK